MKKQLSLFILRWILNSCALWVFVRIFGTGYSNADINATTWAFLIAGLIFSVANAVLRPIVIILSLPAILLTLGLFTVVVNGLMVYLSLLLVPSLHMTFWYSVLMGIVLSLLNYVVSSALDMQYARRQEKA